MSLNQKVGQKMIVNMLKAALVMLAKEDSPNVTCAKAVLIEIISHLEKTETPKSSSPITEGLDDEATDAKKELE